MTAITLKTDTARSKVEILEVISAINSNVSHPFKSDPRWMGFVFLANIYHEMDPSEGMPFRVWFDAFLQQSADQREETVSQMQRWFAVAIQEADSAAAGITSAEIGKFMGLLEDFKRAVA